jgi:hypothetical protein
MTLQHIDSTLILATFLLLSLPLLLDNLEELFPLTLSLGL